MNLKLITQEKTVSSDQSNTVVHGDRVYKLTTGSKDYHDFPMSDSSDFSEYQFEMNALIHDLNNQLTLVMGSIEMINSQYADDLFLQQKLDKIKNTIISASTSIRFSLSVGRNAYYAGKMFMLHQLLTELADSLSLSSDSIDVRLDFKAEMSCVRGNRVQLENAFLNLAKNALEAMPDGGILTFETDLSVLDCDKSEEFSIEGRNPYYLIVKIRDTGSGIKPEYLDSVFNRYFTTKEKEQGTGLGLASVSSIIKNHSGYIDFHSIVGTGTEFRITLPLYCPLANEVS